MNGKTLKVFGLALEKVKSLVGLRKPSGDLDPEPVPGGPGGINVEYRMKKKSTTRIAVTIDKVRPRSPGILLLNADGGPRGKGGTITLDVGTDLVLAPDEKVLLTLVIGLVDPVPPDYELRVLGIPNP